MKSQESCRKGKGKSTELDLQGIGEDKRFFYQEKEKQINKGFYLYIEYKNKEVRVQRQGGRSILKLLNKENEESFGNWDTECERIIKY